MNIFNPAWIETSVHLAELDICCDIQSSLSPIWNFQMTSKEDILHWILLFQVFFKLNNNIKHSNQANILSVSMEFLLYYHEVCWHFSPVIWTFIRFFISYLRAFEGKSGMRFHPDKVSWNFSPVWNFLYP